MVMTNHKGPDGANAPEQGRAKLSCDEVRENIVALQRDELSPVTAESIGLHLASCPECREEALSLELASHDYAELPRLPPPPDLVASTMRRIAREGMGSMPAGAKRATERKRAPKPKSRGERVRKGTTSARILLARGTGILRRQVSNPFVRVAVAAALFIVVALLRTDKVVNAAGRAQRSLLGANVSEAVDEVRDAFLEKLRL